MDTKLSFRKMNHSSKATRLLNVRVGTESWFAPYSTSELIGQQWNLCLCPDRLVFQSRHASITILFTQFIFRSQISSLPTLNFSLRHSKFVFGHRHTLRYQHVCLLTVPSTHSHLDFPKTQMFLTV